MFSTLQIYLMLSFLAGVVIVARFVLRAGQARSDCTIAGVLYDTEHSER